MMFADPAKILLLLEFLVGLSFCLARWLMLLPLCLSPSTTCGLRESPGLVVPRVYESPAMFAELYIVVPSP